MGPTVEEMTLPPPEALPRSVHALREACLRGADTKTAPSGGDSSMPLSPREAAFDRFFGVSRSQSAPAAHLARALWDTAATMISLHGSDPGPELTLAVHAVHGCAPTSIPSSIQLAPELRWIHGHRLFFALIQCAVVGLKQATSPSGGAQSLEGVEAAHLFMRASATALRLTASFTPAEYRDVVRPLMSPPTYPIPGFSGFWSIDHRALVASLRDYGRTSRRAKGSAPALRLAHAKLSATLGDVYAAHVGVCDRFVGGDRSLLGGSGDAVATLRGLGRARSRLLDDD